MLSYSCVNNPMHIEIYVLFYLRFLFLYWNSAMNCTCICICGLYCICWICALYCICWISVLYWNANIYFVINHYHFFCNIATWTACVYHVGIHVLRNKWYIYIYNPLIQVCIYRWHASGMCDQSVQFDNTFIIDPGKQTMGGRLTLKLFRIAISP